MHNSETAPVDVQMLLKKQKSVCSYRECFFACPYYFITGVYLDKLSRVPHGTQAVSNGLLEVLDRL